MLKFVYKQRITERITAKCPRHPRYNPEKDGSGSIRANCSTCWSIYDLQKARVKLDNAVREFVRRAGPWSRPRVSRRRKTQAGAPPPADAPEVQP